MMSFQVQLRRDRVDCSLRAQITKYQCWQDSDFDLLPARVGGEKRNVHKLLFVLYLISAGVLSRISVFKVYACHFI